MVPLTELTTSTEVFIEFTVPVKVAEDKEAVALKVASVKLHP
jgi:hypothetical protein